MSTTCATTIHEVTSINNLKSSLRSAKTNNMPEISTHESNLVSTYANFDRFKT